MSKWNELPCPACKKPVAADASKCPYCQTEISEQEQKARKSQLKGSIGCGIVAVACLGFAIAYCGSGGGNDELKPEDYPAAGSAAPEIEQAVLQLNDGVMGVMASCDTRLTLLGDRIGELAKGSGDAYRVYRDATGAASVCQQSYSDLVELSPPDALDGAVEDKAEKAIKDCRSAAIAKKMHANEIAKVLDGGASMSAVAELEDAAGFASSATLSCVAGLMDTAAAAGVDPDKLTPKS